jgi:hypothetical protein
MGNFTWPEWMPLPQDTPPSAPPPDPRVAREEKIANDTRVEQALNRFLTAKQGALFEAPDAFYRTQGEDAIHAAPVTTKNLDQLRSDLIDGLGNDYQRQRLGTALDAQMQLTRDGMARHVAEQSLAWQRGVAQDRIAILTKEAAQHHNDTDLVDALGHAAASAARAHSRVGDGPPGGEAEDAAAAQARSGVLGAAIQARLDRGDTAGANALLTHVQDQLDPAHAGPLQGQIDTVQRLGAAKDYADSIAPGTPAASLEEIDAQHQAAVQQAEADHPDDPRQQTLARHFLNQAFDARRQELQQGEGSSANAVDEWLNTPGADGGPQRNLPSTAVLSGLDDNALDDLVTRLDPSDRRVVLLPDRPSQDDGDIKVVPLPDKPSMDGAFVPQNFADVPEGESTPGQSGGGIVPVNGVIGDATGAPQANPQLAQAPAAAKPAATTASSSVKPPISENERDAAQSLLDEHSARAKAELDVLASTPRTSDDNKYKGPLPADWEKRLPADTLKKLDESAAQYGVPRNLIAAILWEESTFKEKASAGPTAEGQGMAGMSLGAQKDLITKAQRDKNPERESELKTFDRMKGPAAVSMAAEYLKQLYDDNGQHWPSATLAYRLGRSAVRDWLNGMGNDTEKIYPTRWEEGKTYLRKIFQGRSHLFDTENAPEYP